MRKYLLVILLLFPYIFVQARVVIYKQCTTICVSDNYNPNEECYTKCEFVFVDVGNDNGGGSGDIDNGGSSGGSGGEPGDGGSGDINNLDIDGDGLMDCWQNLTGSKRITEDFGTPRNNTCDHTGLDIGTAQEGGKLPLSSATSGTITEIGYQSSGAGYFIRVQNDNGSYTVYCHLAGNKSGNNIFIEGCNFKVGDHVSVGDVIGTTDSSPNVAAHLDIKFYFVGELSLSQVQEKFPNANLDSSDIIKCTVTGQKRTYVNPEKILGDCN